MVKPLTDEWKDNLAADILKRAMKINRRKTAMIFVSYSPHVDWLDVIVYLEGWTKKKLGDYYLTIDFKHTPELIRQETKHVLRIFNELEQEANE